MYLQQSLHDEYMLAVLCEVMMMLEYKFLQYGLTEHQKSVNKNYYENVYISQKD